jgi:hypothetical protein
MTPRRLAGISLLFGIGLATAAQAGPLPALDASVGLRPSAATRAKAARARSAPALRRLATVRGMDERYDVPTLLWATRPRPVTASALRPTGASAVEAARRHLGLVAGHYRLQSSDVTGAPVRYVHDTGRGGIVVAFRQEVDGIEVFRDEVKVLLDRDHELVAVSGYIPGRALLARAASREFRLAPARALAIALGDFAGQPAGEQGIRLDATGEGGYQHYDVSAATADFPDGLRPGGPVRVRRTLFHMPDALLPAWSVELMAADQAHLYVVDANDGRLLFRHDLVDADAFSYRVFAQATGDRLPHDGPQGTAPTPHPTGLPDLFAPGFTGPSLLTLQNGPISTADAWLAPGATVTSGNNVNAYADLAAPDGFGIGDLQATVTAPGTFDRTYDTGLDPAVSSDQRMASVTQLFYVNNFLHDWFYDSGFDEASGNAQASNYGRGGLGGDALRAEAQDYGGLNNANMASPPDGGSPRMQMYVFTPPGLSQVQVSAPGEIAFDYPAGIAPGFGAQSFNLGGELILGVDGTAPANDGCQALTNAAQVAGRIVLLDRGTCSFTVKAQAAQNAGAIGLIIADNVPGSVPPAVGGTIGGITIPVLSVTQATGNAFKSALGGGLVTLTMVRQASLRRDGTIDNQIVAHEWGHFISDRLVGNGAGLSTSMAGGLGEGWADFHALLITVREEDLLVPSNANWSGIYAAGSYALYPSVGTTNAFYFGVRRCPYSTDLTKNALTFRHIENGVPLPAGPPTAFGQSGASNAEVHNTGEVWCNMLWECYAGLLRDSGRLTFTQAQQRMRDYLVLGYKLTPNAPTLLEARDALLLAAWTHDTADFLAFWQAFAKRGAGSGAVAPDRFDVDNSPVVESFVLGGMLTALDVTLSPEFRDCEPDGYLDNGEIANLSLTLTNSGSATLSNTSVTLSSANPHVSFPTGNSASVPALAPFGVHVVTLPVELSGAAGPELVTVVATYDDPGTAVPGPFTASASVHANVDEVPSFTESVETNAPPWVPQTLGGSGTWSLSEEGPGDRRFLGEDIGVASDHVLVSPPLSVAPTGTFSFSFQHNFDFERDASFYYDGGVVEITTDGGTWTDIGGALSTAYPDTLYDLSGNPLGGRPAYVGQSAGYPANLTTTANLGTTYQGQVVRVRFRVATDVAVGGPGWRIATLTFNNLLAAPFFDLGPDGSDCTPVTVDPAAPTEASLALAGANPASGPRSFRFGLPSRGPVELAIYDVSGRRVATLADGEQGAGWHTRTWSANEDGARPASGIYFARLRLGGRVLSSRVVMLR